MICKNCGKEIDESAAFCRYCGTAQDVNGGSGEETAQINRSMSEKKLGEEKKPAEKSKISQGTDTVSKKKNLLPFLIGGIAAVAVLVVLIVALSAVAVYNSPGKKYDRQLSLAERYLDELDYEKAIAAYKAAIEIDPNNPEAYKALAELYMTMSDNVSAQETVQAGIDATGDAGLTALLEQIGTQTESAVDDVSDQHPAVGTVTVTVLAANETGAIGGAEVKLTGPSGELSAETDSSGNAVFSDLAYGDYTVKCDADGYHKRELSFNLSGPDYNSMAALVPEVSGDDAYVLLTWNGEHDLDLCAFNSDMKEYVNIGHPADSEGNVFLYADHGADQPYEVIYIHNASAEIAKTIYVADTANARNGSSSSMENDGVTVRVYDSTGLIYESMADTSESAPLWCPCYYYAGTVYDQQDYIYDTTGEQYAWISFDEKDAYTAQENEVSEEEWKKAYLGVVNDYLSGWGEDFQLCWALIYLDDDDIPELIRDTGTTAGGEQVYTYHNGEATEIYYAYSGIGFICGEGLINGGAGHGYTSESVERLKNGTLTTLWIGECDDLAAYEGEDFDAEPIYYSNSEKVSEQEYNDARSRVFDGSKAVCIASPSFYNYLQDKKGYICGMTSSEIITALTPAAQVSDNGDWKQAYLDALKHIKQESWSEYGVNDVYMNVYIIELDDDGIPDLYVEPMTDQDVHGGGHDSHIFLSCQNGKVYQDHIGFSGGVLLYYIPRSGIWAECTPAAYAPKLNGCRIITQSGFMGYTGTFDMNKMISVYDGECMDYDETVEYLSK